MKLVNITIPRELNRKVVRIAKKRYTSTGEYVRSSLLRLLSKYNILPQAAKIDLLRNLARERMQKRKEIFDRGKEIKELRKIRDGICS